MSRYSAWCYIVRAAECREKVVERVVIGEIDHRKLNAPLIFVAVKTVVVADGKIKQMPRRNPRGIVVIVLSSRCRHFDQR